MRLFCILFLSMASSALGRPQYTCPEWLSQRAVTNDIGFLCETVSWNSGDIDGLCSRYTVAHESSGPYDTRMRIYRAEETGDHFIVFRPTQQNPTGGSIHAERKMVPCTFFPDCIGNVHERFQQAFIALIETVPDWTAILEREVFIAGHSLGGVFAEFMGFYLWQVHNRAPTLILSLAGPFIGDETFAWYYHYGLRQATQDMWWQVETVSLTNENNFDGTVEGYQVDDSGIFIDRELICGFPIEPLPIPSQSYGMHDLNQYRLFLKGTE
jgi:hypothetical protein